MTFGFAVKPVVRYLIRYLLFSSRFCVIQYESIVHTKRSKLDDLHVFCVLQINAMELWGCTYNIWFESVERKFLWCSKKSLQLQAGILLPYMKTKGHRTLNRKSLLMILQMRSNLHMIMRERPHTNKIVATNSHP